MRHRHHFPDLRIVSVQGGQYGSEGKGAITALIGPDVDGFGRVGGPNAGHTIYNPHSGQKYVFQTLPCGAAMVDDGTPITEFTRIPRLYIGAGGFIEPLQLIRELALTRGHKCQYDIKIDGKASVILPEDIIAEAGMGLKGAVGSTGKGVGAAMMRRIGRRTNAMYKRLPMSYSNWYEQLKSGAALANIGGGGADYRATIEAAFDSLPVPSDVGSDINEVCNEYLDNDDIDNGFCMLLEGTQGIGLSLTHGPWPYVTSRDIGTTQMLSDFGLPCVRNQRRIMVLRTFPIRVHGNSGPMANEITWEQLSQQLGRAVTEQTTVTKLTRRIGTWDYALVDSSIRREAPHELAITFLDYLGDGSAANATSVDDLPGFCHDFLKEIEDRHGVDVGYVSWGPKPSQAGRYRRNRSPALDL